MEESVSRHVSVQVVDIFNNFCEQTLQTVYVIWFKWLLSMMSDLYCVDV